MGSGQGNKRESAICIYVCVYIYVYILHPYIYAYLFHIYICIFFFFSLFYIYSVCFVFPWLVCHLALCAAHFLFSYDSLGSGADDRLLSYRGHGLVTFCTSIHISIYIHNVYIMHNIYIYIYIYYIYIHMYIYIYIFLLFSFLFFVLFVVDKVC